MNLQYYSLPVISDLFSGCHTPQWQCSKPDCCQHHSRPSPSSVGPGLKHCNFVRDINIGISCWLHTQPVNSQLRARLVIAHMSEITDSSVYRFARLSNIYTQSVTSRCTFILHPESLRHGSPYLSYIERQFNASFCISALCIFMEVFVMATCIITTLPF